MAEQDGDSVGRLFERLRGLYRRRPVVAWSGTAALVGVIVAVVAIIAISDQKEPANTAIKCAVSDSYGSVAMELHGKVTQKEADAGCDGVAAKLSGEGRYWRVGLPEPPSTSPEVVCAFNAPAGENGTVLIEANPESLTSVATALCGQFAHEGWTQQTQGGVMGEWQAEYNAAVEAEEEAEAVERELLEEERVEREEREHAVYRCEEQATAKEEAEVEAIQQETEERVATTGSESEEFRLEEEGWKAEERAWARGEEADARCQESEGAKVEGDTEFR